MVLADSGIAARALGLARKRMPNEEIDAAAADYRLVQLDLVDRRDDNPVDLQSVWVSLGVCAVTALGLVAGRPDVAEAAT